MEGGFTAAPRGKLPIRPSEPSPQPLYVSRWKEAAKKNGWKWIATRPGVIIGTSKGNVMSLGVSLALYATARKALGQPLTFPGSSVSFNLPYDHSTESIGLQADIMSNFVSFMSQRRGGSERSLGDSYEKVSLLPTSDLESDSSLDLPGRHRARHGHPHWRQIRHGWRLQKLVIRIVFFLALATIYFVSFDSRGSPASRSSLAAGLEHCRYIATTPGPSADFHQREHSDRFEAGTKAVLLKNAKIWTGNKDGSEVIEGDVLMANGLIKSVGQADVRMLEDLRAEGDVDEIDVDGKWVSPGMVDGHSHAGEDGSNSVANNIHPYVRVLDDFDTHDAGTRLIIAGGVTSQLLLPGSGVGIGGQAYVAKFRPTSSNSASARLVEPPFDFHPSGNMTSQRIPSHWRHMKHALGENPDRVFGIVRMDNIWDIRKAYKTAQDWKKKQDDWCSAAQSSSRFFAKDLGEFPEAPLESEALVDVLNGKIKLNVHSYEVTDFDALIRLTNEFGIEVAGIHHAHEAWLVPELLKKAYKHPPAVCVFATFSMYKTESSRNSFYAPKILSDAGLEVVMKSDHSGVVARYLMQEAALAHHWGLEEATALSAVTTHPAKMIGLDHRIGYLSPGYDADVVVWQSHPLAVGAAPAQVYIDGIPQLDPPVLRSRPESDQSAPPAGNWTKEIAYDIATKGDPDYSPRAVHLNMAFINVSSVILRRDGSVKDLSPSDATFDVVVDRGEIDCIGKCAFDAEIPIIDLKGGSLAPGLTSSGIPLGLKYEEGSGSFDPDADAMSSETKALTQFAVNKAADGVFFGTKKLWRAVQSGVTHSITHSVADKVLAGTSTFIRLHAEHSLFFGILVDTVALHVTVSKIAAESAEVAQLQLGTLRSLLLGHNGPSQRTPIGKAFEAVSREEIPLVVSVLKADEMARLISIKREVEAEKGTKIRMVFHDATEAHLLAKEIAEAEIGVIVAPARAFPYTAEESRFLPGVPLSNETVISTLWKAGVTVGIGSRADRPPMQSSVFNTRWQLANLIADTTADITPLDAIAMATTNLEKLHGITDNAEVASLLEKDFVAYEGGGMMDFGGSKVVAFSTPDGVAVF